MPTRCVTLCLCLLAARAGYAAQSSELETTPAFDLPSCVCQASGQFLMLSEYVVRDAIDQVPASLVARVAIPLPEFITALGTARSPLEYSRDALQGVLIHGPRHWLLVVSYHSFVKRSAITVIDDRPGTSQYLPPTPAVPGGAHALAQPESIGVTVSVGSGRIFCGVRSQAHSLAITHEDLESVSERLKAPTALSLLQVLAASQP